MGSNTCRSNSAALQSSFLAAMCKAGSRTFPFESFSRRTLTTLSWPCCIATARGVKPSWKLIIKNYIIFFQKALITIKTEICFVLFFKFNCMNLIEKVTSVARLWFAPLWRSNLTTWSWFSWAAMYSGVKPFWDWILTAAPYWIKMFTISVCPAVYTTK